MTATQVLELSEAQRELADARREKTQLDERIAALEAQVRAGDEQAAEQQLVEQYAQQRLAQLRQEAAEQRVREAAAAELGQKRREAEAAAQADLEALGMPALAEALEDAVRALDRLQRLGDARQHAIVKHAKAFVELEMRDRIVHKDGGWIVFEAGGVKFDTNQDHCQGANLVKLATGELDRRRQSARQIEQGYGPLEPFPHPVTRYIDAQKND
ncbi:hypothetical protein C1I97_01610 [Streptomyces sp. NTH33]|uniref:hypothetical protein n=1 Tax=Streptomyces sp. NTH33 TaxID=1735453 RepID=UPI000DA9B985|nr:hypothetical protein [Streptomyces sp. NTH33]PZH20150.1 hypothetical protein C1I97_01610 [Streptomyces sp. NTH33]